MRVLCLVNYLWGGENSLLQVPTFLPILNLPLPYRMLTFSNNVEPANGFLVRYLRRKLLESDSDVNANREELLRVLDWVPKLWYHLHTFLEKHSTSDFLIGKAGWSYCQGQPLSCRRLGQEVAVQDLGT